MPKRRYFQLLTERDRDGNRYVNLQLRSAELEAVGHVTTQWAFLEFLILRESRGLARYLGIEPPEEIEAISFRRRREAWERLARNALANDLDTLNRALKLIGEVGNLAQERHRLTHDMIGYDPADEDRLKAYPRATPQKFGWPLTATRIEKTAHNIAVINYALLSLHRELESVPGASRRKLDRQDLHNPEPDDENQGRSKSPEITQAPAIAIPRVISRRITPSVESFSGQAIPTSIELDRNAAGAHANLGWCKFLTGAIEEAIPALEYALRLSPRNNRAGNWCRRIGVVHRLQSQTDEAILWLEKARSINPALPFVPAILASAYALKGKTELAAAKLREARNLGGAGSYLSSIRTEEMEYFGVPKIRALYEATYIAGLRKAGMPEE